MGHCLFKVGDSYYVWSTVVDSPITFAMTREQLEAHIREKYGSEGLRDLPKRLERVEKTGTSSEAGITLDDLIASNRAGPDMRHISKKAFMTLLATDYAAPAG